MSETNFTGNGYSKEPLSEIELRKHRHMFHKIDENFIILGKDDIYTIKMLTPVRKAWPFITIVFGVAIYAAKTGLI